MKFSEIYLFDARIREEAKTFFTLKIFIIFSIFYVIFLPCKHFIFLKYYLQ